MTRSACALALLLVLPSARGQDSPWQQVPSVVPSQDMARVLRENRLDSRRLERDLQGLEWEQFRAVIEAVPKLKADVDAYGAAGWEFVKGRYQTHEWRKNIDKLDATERERLAALIETAQRRE